MYGEYTLIVPGHVSSQKYTKRHLFANMGASDTFDFWRLLAVSPAGGSDRVAPWKFQGAAFRRVLALHKRMHKRNHYVCIIYQRRYALSRAVVGIVRPCAGNVYAAYKGRLCNGRLKPAPRLRLPSFCIRTGVRVLCTGKCISYSLR